MTFDRIKRMWWNLWLLSKGVTPGKAFSMMSPCYIYTNNGGYINTGDHLSLNHNVTIDASDHGSIIIGDDVAIGPNTVLRSSNHDHINGGHIPGKIHIENHVWIGANCVILPGTTIGKGAIVGAGSIVTKSIPANVVAVGNPCRPIKNIWQQERER
jgi:galactoside O-acetyltransferase